MENGTTPLLPETSGPACGLRFLKNRKLNADGTLDVEDKESVAASVVTLFLTLPALLGSCCWPVLLAGLIGISATAASRAISHTFSFALTLTILTNLMQLMWHKAAAKGGIMTHWQRYGPTYLLGLATPLVLADQVRHCLQDAGIWPEPSSSMFIDSDVCNDVTGLKGLSCLTLVGWVFAIGCTYSGFALLMASVLWSTKLLTKLHMTWKGEECGCDV